MSKQIKPQNLLFIFSDQHSKEKFGAYGNEHIHTPNLDKLAEEGALFENAYTNNPICCPARSSLATGDYCHKNRYWDNAHAYDGEATSWGERLNEQGHKVITVGKLHFKNNGSQTGFHDQRIPLHVKNGVGDITQNIREGKDRSVVIGEILGAGAGGSDYLDYDLQIAETAAEILKTELVNEENPWCLKVGFVCPHYPWKVPEELLKLYEPYDKLPFPVQWSKEERPMHERIEFFRNELGLNSEEITDDVVRKTIATYYALCTYMDIQVGKVIDALKESGMYENTRIIYTSDHGDSMGDHGLFFKHNMFEGSVGIPMIMTGKGIPKGMKVSDTVSLVDIYPTIIEAVGGTLNDYDKSLSGTSLFSFLGEEKQPSRAVLSESHAIGAKDGIFMVRYEDYKLIYYVGSTPLLFNITKDPKELVDLAQNVNHKETLDMMIVKLREICNPEELDAQAKADQEAMLNEYGGREAVLNTKVMSYSPTPK